MKRYQAIFYFISILAVKALSQQDDFPVLKGPYLGQKPPVLTPELFAPGIVSTKHHEHSRIEFSKDGMELYWTVIPVDTNYRTRGGRPFRMDLQSIQFSRNSSGGWSSPQALQIIKNKDTRSPVLSPDEKSLYFFSSDPNVDPMKNSKSILYRASKRDNVWSDPVKVSGLIPQEAGKGTMSFCFANNGNLYFDYGEADATGEFVWDIYFSEYQNGAYKVPVKMAFGINGEKTDWCPWVAPDESYLIWSSHREGEVGNGDLYISFRQANGPWGKPVNMGIEVNTSGQERFPSVSPDGRFLFFARHKDRITYSDIYWMSASVIDTLREKARATEERDRAGAGYSLSQPNDFPKLAGPYLGQKPPGLTPEIFAPGIVSSKDFLEGGCTWSPDLKEFYFARSENSELSSNWSIWCIREEDGVWTEPQVASFSGVYRDFNPFIPPNGKHLIFFRQNNKENKTRMGSWIVDRTGNAWSEPRFFHEAYCLVTRDFRTFYFTTDESKETSKDLGQMTFKDGVFSEPIKLPGQLNTVEWEGHGFISPDGSAMLFDRIENTFVSFLRDDGTWSRGYDLGGKYRVPAISPNGKYIFFESDGDIYWVDAKIIEKFRIPGTQKDDFPALAGPYLGQKPPGTTPEIFAPGIVSTENSEHGTATFSPKGDEVFWATIFSNPFRKKIMYSRIVDGLWTAPQMASFSHGRNEGNPTFLPDGTKLFFASWKSLTDNEKPKHHILYSRKTENGWSEPELVDDIINSISRYWQVSISSTGNIYFEVEFKGPEIYCSEYQNNKYQKPYKVELGFPAGTPFIPSDESYIIFSAADRPDGYGEIDLYISFKRNDGTWTEGKNLGGKINSKEIDIWPIVSPDGKYLFFTSRRDGIQDIFWVNTSFIEELKPEELKVKRKR